MLVTQIFKDFLARRRRRRTTLALATLSDQQLKDIGVTRFDLFEPRTGR